METASQARSCLPVEDARVNQIYGAVRIGELFREPEVGSSYCPHPSKVWRKLSSPKAICVEGPGLNEEKEFGQDDSVWVRRRPSQPNEGGRRHKPTGYSRLRHG